MQILTPDELAAKLLAFGAEIPKEIEQDMVLACMNVEGVAKKNCTPGHSPYEDMIFPTKLAKVSMRRKRGYRIGNARQAITSYSGAPYSPDWETGRDLIHMRDTIYSQVTNHGFGVIAGIIGTPKPYSQHVHEGTSRMQGRPFITDAIASEHQKTFAILSDGIAKCCREKW